MGVGHVQRDVPLAPERGDDRRGQSSRVQRHPGGGAGRERADAVVVGPEGRDHRSHRGGERHDERSGPDHVDRFPEHVALQDDRLTLTYNRTRQAQITRELIEIISGAEAL